MQSDGKSNNNFSKAKSLFKKYLIKLNPFQKELELTEKIIRSLFIFMASVFLYNLIFKFEYIEMILSYILKDWDSYSVGYLLSFFSLPFAIYFLWKRKKAGWILSVIYIIGTIVLTAISFISYFNDSINFNEFFLYIFLGVHLTIPITKILLLSFIIFLVSRKGVREVFKINFIILFGSILFGIVAAILFVYP